MRKHKPKAYFAKLEVTQNPTTSNLYNINQYPTVYFFQKGTPSNFTGLNSPLGIVQWMQKKLLPPLSELYTLSDILTFKNTHDVSIIYFGNNSKHLSILNDLSLSDNDNFYAHCDFVTAYTTYSVKNSTLVLFKNYGNERTEISGKLSQSGIASFINKNSLNKVLALTERTTRYIWKDKNPALFLFKSPSQPQIAAYMDQLFRNVLPYKLNDKIKIVISDNILSKEEQGFNALTHVKGNELPTVRIYDPRKRVSDYYVMKGDINEKNVIEFVKQWEQGKLKAELKSEEPVKVQKGSVYQIVSKTFNKDVVDNDLNVLVMFYSEYSPKCKEVYIVYEKIAEKFKEKGEDMKLRIGIIDLVRNEVDLEEKIKELPTIRFYLKGEKGKVVEMKEEEMNEEGIERFIYNNLNKEDIEIEEGL